VTLETGLCTPTVQRIYPSILSSNLVAMDTASDARQAMIESKFKCSLLVPSQYWDPITRIYRYGYNGSLI